MRTAGLDCLMLCWTASLGIQVISTFNSMRCHTEGVPSTAICFGCGVCISSTDYPGMTGLYIDLQIMLTKLHLFFCRSSCPLQFSEWQCVSTNTNLRFVA